MTEQWSYAPWRSYVGINTLVTMRLRDFGAASKVCSAR